MSCSRCNRQPLLRRRRLTSQLGKLKKEEPIPVDRSTEVEELAAMLSHQAVEEVGLFDEVAAEAEQIPVDRSQLELVETD